MRAGCGAFDSFAFGEEGGLFGGAESVACFDGGFAGHHIEDFVEDCFFDDLGDGGCFVCGRVGVA